MSKSHAVYLWYTLHKMCIENSETKEEALYWYNYHHDFWYNWCYRELRLSHKMYVWVCKRFIEVLEKKGE